MNQQKSSEKLLIDFKSEHPISSEMEILLTKYLNLAFAVGFDTGRFYSKGLKQVAQYEKGKLVEIYPSMAAAGRALGAGKNTIHKVVKRGSTYKNFTFKLYDE